MCTENKHTQTIDIAIGPIGIAADIANPNKSKICGNKKIKKSNISSQIKVIN